VGLARCGTVFPVSVVVGAAVPAAVCRWGLCPALSWCEEVSFGGVLIIIFISIYLVPNPGSGHRRHRLNLCIYLYV